MDVPAQRGRRSHPAAGDADDGWGPATSVRSSYAAPATEWQATPRQASAIPPPIRREAAPAVAERAAVGSADRLRPRERGLAGWAALLVLIAIAGVGGIIDTVTGTSVRGGFNIGIIAASVVAILAVRRSAMFPVVVAPPLVYSAASAAMLYLRSGGLHDRTKLIDGAINWLVYGFPAVAAATAAVLIIAGIRLIARR